MTPKQALFIGALQVVGCIFIVGWLYLMLRGVL